MNFHASLHRRNQRLHLGWFGSSCIALTVAAGCTMDGASDTELALAESDQAAAPGTAADPCPVPGTLAFHVAQAGAGGYFDYDPAGALTERVKGRYHEPSRRFRWYESFRDDSFLDERVVRGVATSFGALQSLTYEVAIIDVLDDVSVTEVEETWTGCEVERRSRPVGGTEDDWRSHVGSYDGSTYTYLEEQVPHVPVSGAPIILVPGTVFPDQSWSEEFEGGGGGAEYYQTRTGDGSGSQSLSWLKDYGDAFYRGSVETAVDGTQHHNYSWSTDGDGCGTSGFRDWTIAHDGTGTGTSQACDYSDDEYGVPVACTLSVTPGQCVESCENGEVFARASCLD